MWGREPGLDWRRYQKQRSSDGVVNTRSDERAGGRGGPSLRGETANRSGSRAGHFLIRALVAALAIVLIVVTFTISLVVFLPSRRFCIARPCLLALAHPLDTSAPRR